MIKEKGVGDGSEIFAQAGLEGGLMGLRLGEQVGGNRSWQPAAANNFCVVGD